MNLRLINRSKNICGEKKYLREKSVKNEKRSVADAAPGFHLHTLAIDRMSSEKNYF